MKSTTKRAIFLLVCILSTAILLLLSHTLKSVPFLASRVNNSNESSYKHIDTRTPLNNECDKRSYFYAADTPYNTPPLTKSYRNFSTLLGVSSVYGVVPDYFQEDSGGWMDDWIPVTENVFIYSAYLEQRLVIKNVIIRIMSTVPRNKLQALQCLIKKKGSSKPFVLPAVVEIIREHHDKPYAAAYIFCFTPFSNIEYSVGLQSAISKSLPTVLPIHRKLSHCPSKGELAVCVRPFFGPFDESLKLAEFLAYYDLMGASHFTFYNYHISSDVNRFLHGLFSTGVSLDLLAWSLPDVAKTMYEHGQMAAIEDCIYRNLYKFRYVVLVDVDEFLVPRHHSSILDLLKHLNLSSNKSIGSFVFRQSFFCKDGPFNISSYRQGDAIPLMTERYTVREKHVWPAGQRSKMIIRPLAVYTAGIHHVWRMLGDWEVMDVSMEEALLNHYRNTDCHETAVNTLVPDRTAAAYASRLRESRILQTWRDMFLGLKQISNKQSF